MVRSRRGGKSDDRSFETQGSEYETPPAPERELGEPASDRLAGAKEDLSEDERARRDLPPEAHGEGVAGFSSAGLQGAPPEPTHRVVEVRQGPFTGRGPRGWKRSDERIREEVCERLTDDEYVDASDVVVEVVAGEVTLTGTVEGRRQKRRAEDVAAGVAGVLDVHNRLRIRRPASASSTTGGERRDSWSNPMR